MEVGKEDIDDIEDIVKHGDFMPMERYNNKNHILVRAKKNAIKHEDIEENELKSVISGTQSIYVKTWGCSHNNSDSEYMAGQLAQFGYHLTSDKDEADLWLLNSCTVKNPSEDTFKNDIKHGLDKGKKVVLAGCVPAGSKKQQEYTKGLSIVGVDQIDRVVEVVEETLKGNTVKLLQAKKENGKRRGPSLLLPKIRKNPLIEIIPINSGCLNQCTYCKTKHARGNLVSYPVDEIIQRAKDAFNEGVVELWLTSEDTGTYGRDIGSSLPELLYKLIEVVPENCKIRLGMTNPPYILEHLEAMSDILNHPKVYSFLHIPVQSGSDCVLGDMKREYCIAEFEKIVDFLRDKVPGITIATDIICGFPTETLVDFEATMKLCKKYKFPSLFINQFFPRPGTPAFLMKKIPPAAVKKRTKRLTDLFHSYEVYSKKIGQEFEVLVTELSHDKNYYVGHNKFYEQVLLPMRENLMGKAVNVRIVGATKFSMLAEIIDNEDEWRKVNENVKENLLTEQHKSDITETKEASVHQSNFVINFDVVYIIIIIIISFLLFIILKFIEMLKYFELL